MCSIIDDPDRQEAVVRRAKRPQTVAIVTATNNNAVIDSWRAGLEQRGCQTLVIHPRDFITWLTEQKPVANLLIDAVNPADSDGLMSDIARIACGVVVYRTVVLLPHGQVDLAKKLQGPRRWVHYLNDPIDRFLDFLAGLWTVERHKRQAG